MICPGCGVEFEPRRSNQKRCRRECGRNHGPREGKHHARNERRAAHVVDFVGVDGEGISDPAGSHSYCLLSIGDRHFEDDGRHLDYEDVFASLWGAYLSNKTAHYVGYYLGYDFSQWLRTLPSQAAYFLFHPRGIAKRKRRDPHLPPFPVTQGQWEFDILGMRRFKLRRRYSKEGWLTICDVGPFFQMSFLKAIDPRTSRNPIVTQAEYELIAEGKARRATAQFDQSMIRYNQLECEVLARLMKQQNEGLTAEGVRLNRTQWIGPGQAAQKWLRLIKAPEGKTVREAAPESFREAARASYYGGWFEIFWHGPREGNSYGYDINSAYPFIMAGLPCLLHGRYRSGNGNRMPADLHPMALVLAKAFLQGANPRVGAMLHRRRGGTICRPRETFGWFWQHEIDAARRAGFVDSVRVLAWEAYEPCDCKPPLAPIAELYLDRLAVGKNTPAGRAKKLIYNSGYGKFAQSVGMPVFGNPIYASLITAGCRTMITDAIATHPRAAHDLLMCATDSVTFASPHPGLHCDDAQLGAWSPHVHENLSLMLPGVYWDDETRERIKAGGAPALKSRGIAAGDLAARISRVDRAWTRFRQDGWPRLVLPIGFQLVSPRQAMAWGRWEDCGTVKTDGKRIISANPVTKRDAYGPGWSAPYQRCETLESVAYKGTFGDHDRDVDEPEFGDHPDGPIGGVLLPEIMAG